ncbi:MAG TPA: hypothetical protein ENJ95_04185 [Bacteroidetes bacterium]|nr:hypothetical protein [Bacteroidota bacterium]
MKKLIQVIAILLLYNIGAYSQSIKYYEKKAKKAFEREAYGMALLYSQAILKEDSQHVEALYWCEKSARKLSLLNEPARFFTHVQEAEGPVPMLYVEKEKQDTAATKKPLFPKEINSGKNITLIVRTFNKIDSSALNGTYIGLTNDGFGEGDFFQNGNDSNTSRFNIKPGQFLTVTASKDAYIADLSTINLKYNNSADTIFRNLYLAPSWGFPLPLYFDYNKPAAINPDNKTTTQNYGETHRAYLQKIDEYIAGHATGQSMEEKAKSESDIGIFFGYSVQANYDKLMAFFKTLKYYLKNGNNIELNIEGYTGPKEYTENNAAALASRRIKSIKNYLLVYNDDIFKKYLKNGQLKINEILPKKEPFENIKKENTNIYDPEIAKYRKVIIKEIIIN